MERSIACSLGCRLLAPVHHLRFSLEGPSHQCCAATALMMTGSLHHAIEYLLRSTSPSKRFESTTTSPVLRYTRLVPLNTISGSRPRANTPPQPDISLRQPGTRVCCARTGWGKQARKHGPWSEYSLLYHGRFISVQATVLGSGMPYGKRGCKRPKRRKRGCNFPNVVIVKLLKVTIGHPQ